MLLHKNRQNHKRRHNGNSFDRRSNNFAANAVENSLQLHASIHLITAVNVKRRQPNDFRSCMSNVYYKYTKDGFCGTRGNVPLFCAPFRSVAFQCI